MKTDLFQSCGHSWVFQICWHIACSTFTASSFRFWNSLTGIPSPPLALFVVMPPKAHLTSLSRMSGSRWVITPSWLSGSWRSFLYSSSVYSCHLFLIFSASVRSLPWLYYVCFSCRIVKSHSSVFLIELLCLIKSRTLELISIRNGKFFSSLKNLSLESVWIDSSKNLTLSGRLFMVTPSVLIKQYENSFLFTWLDSLRLGFAGGKGKDDI